MISIRNISFSYIKNKKVLNDVSFDINDGECVVLLGPNGAGKSTLISLILKAHKPLSGTIHFDNLDIKKMNALEKAKYISYVPQLINGTSLTVRETVLLGRLPFYKIYPNKKDYELVENLLKEFNLIELKDKETNQISGGERQKVSVARGIIQDSKVIIFDEPTSNLDIKAQQDVINLIKNERNKNHKSFLISIHDLNQALAIGDKFVFLKEGEVFKVCNKDEIDESLIESVYNIKTKTISNNGGKYIIYEN